MIQLKNWRSSNMIAWKNLDTLESYQSLQETKGSVDLAQVMAGESGAERVRKYSVPMAEGLTYHYAAKIIDDTILEKLAALAKEAQLSEKFEELYDGAVINLTENRRVLHHLCRGQLGKQVMADGVDKRVFYTGEQAKIAAFANKVHAGEITNEKGEKFNTVVQIGIGGSDLGPRAIYLALENWAAANGTLKMEAKFISNVDPDDPVGVLRGVDVEHALFIVVSKSGTTLETLTNESFVKDALEKAGLDVSKHMLAVTSETSPMAKNSGYLAAFFMDDYIGGRYSSSSAVGGAVLSLAFGPEVQNALLAYLNERKQIIPLSGNENAFFLSMQRRRITPRAVENLVKKYAALTTSLKKITPHKLRSTYGTSLYRATGDIYLVADVLGHKDVNTTRKHYAAIEEDRRKSARNIVRLRKDNPAEESDETSET